MKFDTPNSTHLQFQDDNSGLVKINKLVAPLSPNVEY